MEQGTTQPTAPVNGGTASPDAFALHQRGFRNLLEECLHIKANDELLVIYDESFAPFKSAFVSVVEEQSISTTLIDFPRSYQDRLVRQTATSGTLRERVLLPSGVVAAINNSTAIINVLDGDSDTASLRRTINHTGRMKMCRLATIPGISAEILSTLVESPFADILADCERVAWLLGEARQLTLITYDSRGREYELSATLEGWDNEPIMSPGVLLPGSWGNVPPGETFCCPPHHSVHGSICINGSVPGHVLSPEGELVLSFDAGTLVSWRTPTKNSCDTRACAYFEQESQKAQLNNDPQWNTFAELGIGLNPVITTLTGNSLFDEKAKHTVHIAIGDNSAFGHDIVSFLHADLVTVRPDLILDGTTVMTRGQIAATSSPDMARVQRRPLAAGSRLTLRNARVHYEDGLVKRRLTKAHRVNYVGMADPQTAVQLAALCAILHRYGTVNYDDFVRQTPRIGPLDTVALLEILNHYGILQVAPDGRRT